MNQQQQHNDDMDMIDPDDPLLIAQVNMTLKRSTFQFLLFLFKKELYCITYFSFNVKQSLTYVTDNGSVLLSYSMAPVTMCTFSLVL